MKIVFLFSFGFRYAIHYWHIRSHRTHNAEMSNFKCAIRVNHTSNSDSNE